MPEEEKKAPPVSDFMSQQLFASRSVFVYGSITQELAKDVCSQLIALAQRGPGPIRVFINSPGGHVESGDSIYDMIKFIGPKVSTIGTGWVASAGALIFLGAEKQNRFCLPNTRFLLHQPSGGIGGPPVDIEIQAREIIKMKERMNQIVAKETGQPIEKVRQDTERDYWMGADEAIAYGMLSKVVHSAQELD
jgi:ATP-dependent Clp protease protease subunit